MAVYTSLSNTQIQDFITQYALTLVSATEISAGTENSNYLLQTQDTATKTPKAWVLTLFESMPEHELQQVINLTQTLAQQAVPVPTAIANAQQRSIQSLCDKPCILTPFVEGKHPQLATAEQCYQVAAALANIHQTDCLPTNLPHYDLLEILTSLSTTTQAMFSNEEFSLILQETAYYSEFSKALNDLPTGPLHTDLFKDNTLFKNDQLLAILDFYSAAHGTLLFDLAILINDWCFDENNVYLDDNLAAVLQGYQSKRLLSSQERALLPLASRMTACRFWLSRNLLKQQHQQVLSGKNPENFKQRLSFHLSQSSHMQTKYL